MAEQQNADGSKNLRTYKAGDAATYIAQFGKDVPPNFSVQAFFEREGGADQSGLGAEVILSASRVVDARRVEVCGDVAHVANGKYKLVRVDLIVNGVRQMNNNPDPDGDSAFLVVDSSGPSFPNLTDFDPK